MRLESIGDGFLLFLISMVIISVVYLMLVIVDHWREQKEEKFRREEYMKWRDHMKDAHGIPVDYSSFAKVTQQEINAAQEGATTLSEARMAEADHERLQSMRTQVAHIRYNGYLSGEAGHPMDDNPFPRGSGESRQWIRGYCQGANLLNPKPYMDKY